MHQHASDDIMPLRSSITPLGLVSMTRPQPEGLYFVTRRVKNADGSVRESVRTFVSEAEAQDYFDAAAKVIGGV